MPTKLNLAIIGCGGIVRNVHSKHLVTNERIHVAACMDVKEENAVRMAEMLKANYHTTDLERVLSDKSIDAVLIATLPDTHAELSILASRAGKAVFCEKPVSDSLEKCVELGKVLRENKTVYMVGYCYRFCDAVLHSRGKIPSIDYSLAHVMARENERVSLWHNYLHNYCHAADLVRYFHGCNPVRVAATGNEAPSDLTGANGKMVSNIFYENGAMSTIVTGGKCVSPYLGKWFYKFCDSDNHVAEVVDYKKSKVAGDGNVATFDDDNSYFSGHKREMELFVRAVKDGDPSPVPFSEGIWNAVIMDATKKSYESGKIVMMDEYREILKEGSKI